MIDPTKPENVYQMPGHATVSDISELARRAGTPQEASVKLAELLAMQGLSLLFYAIYDVKAQRPSEGIYCDLPQRVVNMCAQFDDKVGCPAIRQARKAPAVFDAVSFDYADRTDFADLRYIQELRSLGYDEIAVVPVVTGQDLHILFVGSNHRGIQETVGRHLLVTAGLFVACILVRFENHDKNGVLGGNEKSALSGREVDCLHLCAMGKSRSEIGALIGLSEFTTNMIIRSACAKLNSANAIEAVTKAIGLGIIRAEELRVRTH